MQVVDWKGGRGLELELKYLIEWCQLPKAHIGTGLWGARASESRPAPAPGL